MGSERSQLTLPVIDFSKVNLIPNTSQWVSTFNKVQQAFVDYGCFVVKYDQVLPKLHNQMLGEVKGVLDSIPSDFNSQNTFDDPWYYFRRPIHALSNVEGFNLRDATTHDGVTSLKSFAESVWPLGNDAFCNTFLSYAKMLTKLDQIVTKMVLESYGVGKNYESHVDSMTYSMLVLRYGATQDPALGLPPHSDKSFITILDTNHVKVHHKGLEIQTIEGDHWLSYNPVPGHAIVMAGDAFFGWSNGRIHSATHRVLYGGNEDRYTLKLTSYARDLVEVPKELVDDGHPLLFKPFSNLKYAEFSRNKLGESADSGDLKLYCRV